MVTYDPKAWLAVTFFWQGTIWPRVLVRVLALAGLTLVYWVIDEALKSQFAKGVPNLSPVAHQILEIAYYVMHDGVTYQELGADYFDRRHAERAVRRHVRQLEALGYKVTIDTAA